MAVQPDQFENRSRKYDLYELGTPQIEEQDILKLNVGYLLIRKDRHPTGRSTSKSHSQLENDKRRRQTGRRQLNIAGYNIWPAPAHPAQRFRNKPTIHARLADKFKLLGRPSELGVAAILNRIVNIVFVSLGKFTQLLA